MLLNFTQHLIIKHIVWKIYDSYSKFMEKSSGSNWDSGKINLNGYSSSMRELLFLSIQVDEVHIWK